ncbi:helix-turn-helix domain-containing protein [Pontixanthobacter aestiaquae]|uniref:Helix-turn-helix domain-containing protein n=1 Tax=Pontixanthobacter aestiaquae TaxID=1509367 RepID=A0A844Z8E9_9SPHN|nr:helix-turn-helix domain-containing protein [Pontixanthobacter aestiaquae]MDN3645656.1 helix-turn-helix domain-containing protein [Pontixanthobacter aestiaquae]MXO83347.1 helix-turn-helix domain-containing protein [Pontixanthobacter aestiaquae]
MTGHSNLPADTDHPISDAELNKRLAQHGVALRPSAGEAGRWPAGWLPGDDPVEIDLDADSLPPRGGGIEGGGCTDGYVEHQGEPDTPTPNPLPQERGLYEPLHPAAVFDTGARVRFLDALAGHGNVRSAAAQVGVSRETVYRARRRYADFARCWDMALVHARARYEAELAARAVDGVRVPVFVRGEHVATYRRHDARYLLAHLARLDRRIAEDPDMARDAGQFDRLLAAMAGHEPLEDFDAVADTLRKDRSGSAPNIPPTRDEYVSYARSEALADQSAQSDPGHSDLSESDPAEQADRDQAEADAMHRSAQAAGQDWDAWDAAGADLLDRVLAEEAAVEATRKIEREGSVTCVNTAPPDMVGEVPD